MIDLITVPPSEPIITDETGREIRSNKVGPLKKHQSVILQCHVSGGKPLPEVEWYVNGQRVSSTTGLESRPSIVLANGNDVLDIGGDMVTGRQQKLIIQEVRIGPLERFDQDAQITCRTFNSPNSPPKTKTLTLDIQRKL